ncbi:hypothetical protein KUCAC02_000279 [Chaenocephalus aceratus]|uniref:Uncharacterized protein n=1 Tax=Chaenocephalus aceratus TaxID=36190 RepID=A0ACB9W5X4_CHAAC|nr:hypothetical protein KUCAC02_000279 [Chaenocephalus aceratus]
MFKIYVLLVTLFRAYGALLYAEPGQNVTLKCFYTSIDNNLCWYKQDSDSAIYYCGTISGVVTEFDNGTFLVLKGVSPPNTSVAEYTPNIENQESKDLEYEALDFKTMRSKSKRKRSTEDETVYSTVRLT